MNDNVGIIEGILFSYGDPLSIEDLAKIINISPNEAKIAIELLEAKLNDDSNGIFLVKFDDKVQLGAKPYIYQYMKKIFIDENKKKLSTAAMETLSIIAYRQPITKIEVESIRGVKSDNVINRLLEQNLITVSGNLDRIGRPNLYSTTEQFLKQFGLSNISELPNANILHEELSKQ